MKNLILCALVAVLAAILAGCGGLKTDEGIKVEIEMTPEQGAVPLLVTFKAVLSGYEGDPADLTYDWDFGDSTTAATAEPSHTFGDEGTFMVRLTVSDGELSGKAQKEVEVGPIGPGVDLRVDTVDVTPSTINPGGAVTIKVSATNAGSDAATGTVMVRLFILTDESWPGGGNVAQGVINLPGIQGGETIDVAGSAFVPSSASAGPYYVYAFIDGPDPNQVLETNEENNVTRSILPLTVTSGSLPIDLVVDDLTTDLNGSITPGTDFNVTATISNDGTQDAGTFKLAFRLSVDPTIEAVSGDIPLGMLVSVPTIASGASEVVTQTFNLNAALDNRPYYLGVVADVNGDVAETDESNNIGLSAELVDVTGAMGCTEDAFEPNETANEAIVMAEGAHAGLISCPNSVEWYAIDLAAGDRLTADIAFNNADGDLNLELFEAGNATAISSSMGMGNTELVQSGLVTQNTTFHVKVSIGASQDGVPYTMNLTLAHSGGNGRDLVPANVDIAPNSVAAGTNINATYDVFNFGDTDVAVDTSTEIWLSDDATLDTASDLQLAAMTVGPVATMDSQNVALTAMIPLATAPGNYFVFVVVDGANAVAETYEDNNSSTRPLAIGIGCAEDVFEDNDDQATATELSTGTYNVRLCDADDDWFALEVQDGATVDVDVSFAHSSGDIDLQLKDLNGGNVDTSGSTNDGETVTYTNNTGATATYYLRVYYYANTTPDEEGSDVVIDISGAISNTVDLSAAATVTFDPPIAYEGDGVDVTWTVSNLSTEDAPAFDMDLRLSLDSNIDGADIVVRTEASAGLAAGASMTYTKKFTVPAAAVGSMWHVGVFVDSGGSVTEASETNNGRASGGRLEVPSPCANDTFESNDVAGNAAMITLGSSYNNLKICSGDLDWFNVVAGANGNVDVRIDFPNVDGDIDLKVYDNDGVTLRGASASGVNDFEEVSFMATAGSTYKVFVKGFNGATNTYSLTTDQP